MIDLLSWVTPKFNSYWTLYSVRKMTTHFTAGTDLAETWFYPKIHRSPPHARACPTGLSELCVWHLQVLVVACSHHGSLALCTDRGLHCILYFSLQWEEFCFLLCCLILEPDTWSRAVTVAQFTGIGSLVGRTHVLCPTLFHCTWNGTAFQIYDNSLLTNKWCLFLWQESLVVGEGML